MLLIHVGRLACRRAAMRLGHAAILAAVCCGAANLISAAGAMAASEPTNYLATESVPVPPASNYAGSGGGDGWAVALSDTQEFNVFHHSNTLQVVCHNQSDGSVCWGPDTITDANGDNFATSGHPGMYLDQSTGRLYVYATRTSSDPTLDATAGVVCVDTTQPASNSNPYCGFTPLTGAGEAPLTSYGISGLSNPMLYGDRLYAFNYVDGVDVPVGARNAMLCFDVSTDAACPGQPYTVSAGAGAAADPGYPTPATALIGNQLIVPLQVNGVQQLACLDASDNSACGGSWPVTLGFNYVGANGPPFPLLDVNGNLVGLCLPTGSDQCYTLAGAQTTTPSGMSNVIGNSDGWNGPAMQLGPRVYVPDGNANRVECFDYSTNGACTNFPKGFSNLGYLYTVNPDPQRPTCIWVNSDNGSAQIQNFDAYTAGPCGQGPVRALASQFVGAGAACAPNAYSYLQIVTPAGASGSVQFDDGDGNPIPGTGSRAIGANGMVDLTGLALNTATGLPQFLITFDNANQSSPSAVTLRLAWTAPYDPSCIDDDTLATNPAISATGTRINTGEGEAFSGVVATFSDPDPGGRASDYSATIDWGDGVTTSGMISGSPSRLLISGGHTYHEEGTYPVTVAIHDVTDGPNDATAVSSAVVADAPLHAVAARPTMAGSAASGTVATFTDGDPGGTLSDYTATISWGDGATTGGLVSAASGTYRVSGSHSYAHAGSYTVKVTIRDQGGSATTVTEPVAAQVKATRVQRGAARVSVACVAGTFTARVRGAQISTVTFRIDGRTMHTLVVERSHRYIARTPLAPGDHTLKVTVRFRKASRTRLHLFRQSVDGCAALPSFTG